jgi:cyanophycin synthetase
MNIFQIRDFKVMLDYAHNTHGLRALGKFINSQEATYKIGILSAAGDRRDSDIISFGEEASKLFDEIIIKIDSNYLRGRPAEEMVQLLEHGIQKGDPGTAIRQIRSEHEAVSTAIAEAKGNSLITILGDNIFEVADLLKKYQQEEFNGVDHSTGQQAYTEDNK